MKNYDTKIKQIKKYLKERRDRDLVSECEIVLNTILKEEYHNYIKGLSNFEREKLNEIKNQITKFQKDENKITLGEWIGIYRTGGIFNNIKTENFNLEILNKIKDLRNFCIHKKGKLNEKEVLFIYSSLIKILRDFEYETSPKVHGLCEMCLENFGTYRWKKEEKTWKFCEKCYKKMIILDNSIERVRQDILKLIFEIRTFFNPKLKERYKKYLPKQLREEPSIKDYLSAELSSEEIPEYLLMGIRWFPETKQERKERIAFQKKIAKEEKRLRDLKKFREKEIKVAMEKVYKEPDQLQIFHSLFKIVVDWFQRNEDAREGNEEFFVKENLQGKLEDFIDENLVKEKLKQMGRNAEDFSSKELENFKSIYFLSGFSKEIAKVIPEKFLIRASQLQGMKELLLCVKKYFIALQKFREAKQEFYEGFYDENGLFFGIDKEKFKKLLESFMPKNK